MVVDRTYRRRSEYVERNSLDDDIPLFISDDRGEPDPSEFIHPLRIRRRSSLSFRILAVVCTASAAAVLFAFLSSDATRVFVQASVAGIIPAPLAATPSDPSPRTASAKRNPVAPPVTERKVALAPNVALASVAPTQDAMKDIYQPQLPAPVVASSPMPPAIPLHRLDPNEVSAALGRADMLIRSGDIAAARLVLRRAADDGDGQAAIKLAETYDPDVLARMGVHGTVPDIAMARDWYEKAKKFGAADAASRLERLANR